MSSNLPDGVSDAHPYFNPPREVSHNAVCGNDEAEVVPYFTVKAEMEQLRARAGDTELGELIYKALVRISALGQEREYECPFADDLDLPESECARWDCPVCGAERETDTLPEERDPDRGWDDRDDD